MDPEGDSPEKEKVGLSPSGLASLSKDMSPKDNLPKSDLKEKVGSSSSGAAKDEPSPKIKGIMSTRIHELLLRNLQEVFGQGNAKLRRAAIDELYTEDCQVYAPPQIFVGHEALDRFAGDLRETHPTFVYTPTGKPQALHDAGRLAWGSGPREEKFAYTGLDVITVRNDKIEKLYVFLDSQ